MATPQFGTFSLQDTNYVTENVEYRTIPVRDLIMENIARKPGKKLLSTEFAERRIRLAGWILGTDSADLLTRIDNLHTNVTRKTSGTLTVDANREIEAIVASVTVAEPHYTQSAVPFELEFLAAEPFWKGPQQTVTLTVASGTGEPHTQSFAITISGTVFAEPSIIYNAPTGTGWTTTSGIIIEYEPTGEKVTWSGSNAANPTLAYGSLVNFNYQDYRVIEGAAETDHTGVMARWEPGETNVNITYSGQAQGGQVGFIYRPRYL
ncbi:MAG TPA: phage tail domain-containing protein [Anaerolineales bacterium]|nr:phage tail domain-containing protein [Anaerolineales bacterium]